MHRGRDAWVNRSIHDRRIYRCGEFNEGIFLYQGPHIKAFV